MRDPNRLDNLYQEMKKLHKDYCPDWRFGQFIYNVIALIGDPFYIEDDKIVPVMRAALKKEMSQYSKKED